MTKSLRRVLLLALLTSSSTSVASERLEPGSIVVVDGDTIKTADEKFRILDIDTPEVQKGMYDCVAEKMLGDQATLFVRELIENAQTVEVERDRNDRYGRTLAHVFIDGENLSDRLLQEGLAGRYEGGQVDWCATAE